MCYCCFVATATRTLKLPFLKLNANKAKDFSRLQSLNTQLANRVLAMPKAQRKELTTASFRDVEIGSAWINQTIRNATAKTKVKQFNLLPLEVNNQNWTLHKIGDTFSVSFGILRSVRKRIPLAIHQATHAELLEAILNGSAKQGSLKLFRSRKGIWYALISVSMEVPDAKEVPCWIGVDRGQNIPAVAALSNNGRLFFFKANKIKHVRRVFAERRKVLQEQGKHRAVKKLDKRESRIVAHINHKISKKIVGLAKRFGFGLRFEDLTGCRATMKQRKKTKSDAALNRDTWPFFQLEQFAKYKALDVAVSVENIPAPYTSKTHHECGHLGVRKGNDFYCPTCDQHEHADGNAARVIGKWYGFFSAWWPSKGLSVIGNSAAAHGVNDGPLNLVSEVNQ
jgi:IS605 OrfB family transposase